MIKSSFLSIKTVDLIITDQEMRLYNTLYLTLTFIDGTQVPVTWEENDSVKELKKILPLTVQMSTYGGFEQVGNLGQSIVRDDKQTKTAAGDIVLYSGDQIVIFYGSNSWAYTSVSVGLNRPFSIGHI